jgi:hypothetical protein
MAYGNFDEEEAAPPRADGDMGGEGDEHMEEGNTSVLPKSFFEGKELEPGTQCKVEIVAVHGDDVEVKYVPHEDNEEEDGTEGARNRMNMAADGGARMRGGGGGGNPGGMGY